tara:strand:+ start:1517 stop:1834 length:318 start_codon:yes stop_codon:yes gene_type:complete
MLIDVKDLQIGDEILVPINSKFAYVKVERQPMLKTKLPSWCDPNKTYYKSVKCKIHVDEKTYTRTYGQRTHTWTRKEIICDDQYNTSKTIDLNNRTIWLIKRNKI